MTPPERWARVAAWFDELAELPVADRAARIAVIAAEDAEAGTELRALLAADAIDAGLLDAGLAGATPLLPSMPGATVPADGRAGPYRLLHAIGEGGMGVVFLGERDDGSYEQRVAVKRIKRGMDSVAIVRRFLRERRILARLAHPHIVRLLDGGIGADGRPYYVMEYVDGAPITAYAGARHLSVRERVALVAEVADAVAYAHAQLVVHRDLKPSNVLIDSGGRPHVLDFGIAKLLVGEMEAELTASGVRVLSPAYAAPEQRLGGAVGTATDVYALGLMLHELLLGQRPSTNAGDADTADGPIERPSLVAKRLATARTSELYGEGAGVSVLARNLAGDLDLILATALRSDPARRYATAAAFADDLRRWLAHRPIAARPESARYRLGRFARRHRVGVAAAVVVAMSLFGGLGVALWQARSAQAQAQRADAERAHAERQLVRAGRVKDFILALFREQDPVSRASAQARSPVELIRDGIAQTDAALAGEPELQAELLRDLGEIQVNLDDRKAGEATLRRAWELQTTLSGDASVASAEALAAYGDAIYAAGDVEKSASMLRDAVARLRVAGAAQRPRTAKAESVLATIELVQGHVEEAERLARHAVEVYRASHGKDDVEVAARLAVLGKIQQETSRYPDALASYREALAIVARNDGEEHVRTATLRTYVGDVLRVQRRYDEALVQYEAALRIERAKLPAGHAILGATLIRLGDLQRRMDNLDGADRSFGEAIAILAKTPSGHYAQALQFHGNLARAQGRLDLAAERYRLSYEAFRTTTGDSVYTWLTALERVGALTDLGRLAEADALGSEAAAAIARLSKDDSYDSMYSASVIGALRHAQGRYGDAIPLLRHSLKLIIATYDENHAEVAQARVALAASLIALQETQARSEAATLIETAKAALERGGDASSEPMLGTAYLERSRLRFDSGDVAGARADIPQAIRRLQSPEHAHRLRQARVLAQRLGVRAQANAR